MVQSRFATYYQNHPETNDISLILETSSTTNKSPLRATSLSQKEIARAKKQRADEWDYLVIQQIIRFKFHHYQSK